MLKGVLIDKAIEVLFQCTGHLGGDRDAGDPPGQALLGWQSEVAILFRTHGGRCQLVDHPTQPSLRMA